MTNYLYKLEDIDFSLYSVLIGVLAPELCGLLLKSYFDKIKRRNTSFFKVKLHLLFIGLPSLFILFMLENGDYKNNLVLQIAIAFLIIIYTFTCYLSSFLDPNINKSIDDYCEEEKEQQKSLSDESKSKNSAIINGREVTL